MKASLSLFKSGLAAIKHYIQCLKYESELLSSGIDKEKDGEIGRKVADIKKLLSKSPGIKKRYEYNTIIISLYGYLEQFIESLIKGYINDLNKAVPTFDDLPSAIKKNHLDLSVGLINRLDLRQYKNKTSPEELISNLHACYSADSCFAINAEAFAQHTANFRIEIIDSYFARVGIQKISEMVKDIDCFKDYLKTIYPGRPTEHIRPEVVFYYLNDLSERRNDVAHGVASDEILSKDYLIDYINFFEVYGESMFEVVYRSILPYHAKHEGVELGVPIAVYNSRIICFELSNIDLKVGDIIIAKPAKTSSLFNEGRIKEIQVDGSEYPTLSVKEPIKIALRIDIKAKHNQTFFHINN